MSAARGRKPIVHFVGSIPLPDAETVFRSSGGSNRSTSKAPALKQHTPTSSSNFAPPTPPGCARRGS